MIHDRKFRVFAGALVTNPEGLILMLRKSETQKIAPGLWLLPDGTIEFGETFEDGLQRELLEEIFFKRPISNSSRPKLESSTILTGSD